MKYIKIKELGEVVSGSTPKTINNEFWNGTLRWITPAEIKEDDTYICDTEKKITELGAKSCSLKLLPKDTVLLTSRAPIGKVALAGESMYCNQGFKNIICNKKIIEPKYMYYWLKNKKELLNSLGRGATFKEISKKIVEDIQIPVLKREEQNKLVIILDKIQELINKRKIQIKALDELVKSQFCEVIYAKFMKRCWRI